MMHLVSQLKEKLMLVSVQQSQGEITEAIATAETIEQLCQVVKTKKKTGQDGKWSVLPVDSLQSSAGEMKKDMIRLKQEGVDDEEIGERMLEKYDGKSIPGVESGESLSWKATALQLSRENQWLEEELQRSEEEVLKRYREEQGDR